MNEDMRKAMYQKMMASKDAILEKLPSDHPLRYRIIENYDKAKKIEEDSDYLEHRLTLHETGVLLISDEESAALKKLSADIKRRLCEQTNFALEMLFESFEGTYKPVAQA